MCIAATSALVSRLVTRIGPKRLLIAGMTSQAIGLLLLTDISAGGSYAAQVLGPSLLVAIGIGLAFVPATITAVSGVGSDEAGLASGIVNTSRMVGGALGLAVLAALATSRTNDDLKLAGARVTQHAAHAALTSGFELAFLVAAAFAAVGAVIAVFALPGVPRRALRRHGQPIAESA
jgi:MFS family permease